MNGSLRWLEGGGRGGGSGGITSMTRQLYKIKMTIVFKISVAMTAEPHSNEMTSIPILFVAVFLDTGRVFPKSLTGAFSSNSCLDFLKV